MERKTSFQEPFSWLISKRICCICKQTADFESPSAGWINNVHRRQERAPAAAAVQRPRGQLGQPVGAQDLRQAQQHQAAGPQHTVQ